MRIGYLSLERPHEGNAAYTHVHEIVAVCAAAVIRLTFMRQGFQRGKFAGLATRILIWFSVQARLMFIGGATTRSTCVATTWRPHGALGAAHGKPICHECNGPFTDLAITHRGAPFRRLLELCSGAIPLGQCARCGHAQLETGSAAKAAPHLQRLSRTAQSRPIQPELAAREGLPNVTWCSSAASSLAGHPGDAGGG